MPVKNWAFNMFVIKDETEREFLDIFHGQRIAKVNAGNMLVEFELERRQAFHKCLKQFDPNLEKLLKQYKRRDEKVKQLFKERGEGRRRRGDAVRKVGRGKVKLEKGQTKQEYVRGDEKSLMKKIEQAKEDRDKAWKTYNAASAPSVKKWKAAQEVAAEDVDAEYKLELEKYNQEKGTKREFLPGNKDITKKLKQKKLKALEEAGVGAGAMECHRKTAKLRSDWVGSGVISSNNLSQVSQAKKDIPKGPPPRFQGRGTSGYVTVEVGKRTVGEILSGSVSMVKIEMPEEQAEELVAGGRFSTTPVAKVSLKLGLLFPWITVSVGFHRLPPLDAKVSHVHIDWERRGYRDHWKLRMCVATEARPQQAKKGTAVAVHLGYRHLTGFGEFSGLRVACWDDVRSFSGDQEVIFVGEDFESPKCGELIIPDEFEVPGGKRSILNRLEVIRSWESNRKRVLNQEIEKIQDFLAKPGKVPVWLKEATEHIHLWKSSRRLQELLMKWEPFNCGSQLLSRLKRWSRADRRYANQIMNGRRKFRNRRNTAYRTFARQLANRYETLVMPDVDFASLRAYAKDGGIRDEKIMKRNAAAASCGILQQFLREAFGKDRIFSDLSGAASKCANCDRKLSSKDAVDSYLVTCPCGEMVDIDFNAIDNQIAMYKASG